VKILERLDRRVLGAVRFVDVTTRLPVHAPLNVRAGVVEIEDTPRGYRMTGGVPIRSTPRGYYVLERAPGLEDFEAALAKDAFAAPPDEPAVGAVAVTLTVVDDRERRYLPRRWTVRLPRDTDRDSSESLFQAVEVAMFPSPAARTSPGWAVLRASLVDNATSAPLPGALLLVRRASDGTTLGRGLSDDRGEALVSIAGIPVTTWGEGAGPVLATRVDATLAVAANPGAPKPPDPDDLEGRLDGFRAQPDTIALGSGVDQAISIRVAPAP
jgi:hypothetical protein